MYRNLIITMLLGGLWHGAAWNFVGWGAFHGGILVAYRLLHLDEKGARMSRGFVLVARWLPMFVLTQIGWLLFRAGSGSDIVTMLTNAASLPGTMGSSSMLQLLFLVLLLALAEFPQHRSGDLAWLANQRPTLRALGYAVLLLGIVFLGRNNGPAFIYFQF